MKYRDASGKSGIENRRNPYVPSFNKIPARITEPAVGASTCASGSQICMGTIGTFTANEAKKANHKRSCRRSLNSDTNKTCKSVVPTWK